MAISLIQIKRWYNMLTGQSVEHVNQDIGKSFSKEIICGYYNDLTQKVTYMPELLDSDKLPLITQLDGAKIIFPVAVFQYALGCYDLWLSSSRGSYQKKFLQCAEWTLSKQDAEGRWDNFSNVYPEAPYGAMAQGEAVSVLIRAYVETKDDRYLKAAKRSIDYMLKPIEDGGTTIYKDGDLLFAEYTHLPVVLNGWIFAWWGLYDYVLLTKDAGFYKKTLEQSLSTLEKYLPRFKNSFWSKYDLGDKITSPFYHHLHIAQMQAMYQLTNHQIFNEYAQIWGKQLRSPLHKFLAFVIKAFQKIFEN